MTVLSVTEMKSLTNSNLHTLLKIFLPDGFIAIYMTNNLINSTCSFSSKNSLRIYPSPTLFKEIMTRMSLAKLCLGDEPSDSSSRRNQSWAEGSYRMYSSSSVTIASITRSDWNTCALSCVSVPLVFTWQDLNQRVGTHCSVYRESPWKLLLLP